MSAAAYRQLWRVVAGAVNDALGSHPDYLTEKGRKSAHSSIVKRVTGTVLGFAEEARGRSGAIPAAETGQAASTAVPSGGALSRLPKNSGTSQPKENGREPENRDRGDISMLNVVERTAIPQGIESFVREGFTIFSAVEANQVLLHAAYDRQRKISEDHVRVLADIMKRNQWEPKDKLDFALLKGELILVNGYHRMSAQVASGKPIEWTVVVHPCRTLDQVRGLYYKFDTNTRIRQGAQVLAGIGFSDKHEISRKMSSALFNAVPIIASNFSKSIKDRDVLANRVMDRRLEIASQYVPAAKVYESCLEGLPVKVKAKFLSAGTTAVAIVTLRYQPLKALEFWQGTASNDGLRKGDPRLALYNDMIARQFNAGSAVQSVFSPAHAWNAFFEDRPLKVIKLVGYRTSVSIAGTPYED